MRTIVAIVALAACQKNVDDRIAKLEAKVDKMQKALDENLPPAEPDPNTVYAVAIDPTDPVQGPPDAKVTIVEAFEFLCPYCYMVAPTVDQVLAKYPKDVRLVHKYVVVHGRAAIEPAMVACAAAKQGKLPQMKAVLWSHLFTLGAEGPELQPDQLSPDHMQAMVKEAGLDEAKLGTDMTSDACTGWLKESAESLRPVNVNATPAFFINGRYLSGAQPLEAFDKVIAEEKAKADAAIAKGVPAAEYYQREVIGKGAKQVKGRFDD